MDVIECLLDEQEGEHQERFEPPDVSSGSLPSKRSGRWTEGRWKTEGGARSWPLEPPRLASDTSDPLEETGETAALLAETAGQAPDERRALAEDRYGAAAGGVGSGTGLLERSGAWDELEGAAETALKGTVEAAAQDGRAGRLPEKLRKTVLHGNRRAVIPRGAQAWYEEAHSTVGEGAPVSRFTAADRTGQASAAALYHRLRRTGEAAQYRGQGESAAALLPTAPRADAVSLNELDRAFQRDARRYDSGFELY